MANTILTPTVIAKEALRILSNNLVFVSKINRDWETEYGNTVNGYKIGASVNIRKPARFSVRSGPTLAAQDLTETFQTLTINNQHGIDVNFTSQEMTLNLSEFSDRVLKPQMVKLANWIDNQAMISVYKQVHNLIGTPGTTPNSFLSIGNGMRRLNENAAPTGDTITTLLDPAAEITLADALKGTFQKQTVDDALLKGYLATLGGTDMFLSQGLPQHTVGPLGGAPLVNGAAQTGSSLVTNGWTASAAARLNQGDVFTIAGVFAVNPLTGQSTGVLANFVVTAPVSSDGSGNATIPIYPSIITSTTTGTQTVTASPANAAALTILTGTAATGYNQNLMFHRDAFAFASVPLVMPNGVHFKAQESYKGLNLRIVQAYDIVNDKLPCRMDVLWGVQTVFPELAVRVSG